MKHTLLLATVIAVLGGLLAACDTMGSSNPTPKPTAQNGATHGAPTQPSTAQ